MAQFTTNASRLDPYKNFKFRVKWDGRYVAGISKVSPLKRTTEMVKHRDGGDPSSSHKSPGKTEYDAITLERGVTHDVDFEQWANKVWNFNSKEEVSLKDFRKDIIIDVFNEACRSIVMRYTGEWEKTVLRMGRWVHFQGGYRTMNPSFMESVWWVFKTGHRIRR